MKPKFSLLPGDAIDNEMLCEIFKCGPQGGMRRSNRTNTLVIVSNHVKSIYDDRWIDDVFHYTGMGTVGDQSLTFMQNKTLAESNTNGVEVHLFEVFSEKEYTYVGQMRLNTKPYQEKQLDAEGHERVVWMFPLRISQGTKPLVSRAVLSELVTQKDKVARKLSLEELAKRAKSSPKVPGSKNVTATQFDRNPWVSEMAQRRAAGRCQLCDESAPFCKEDGTPFLETHHIVWLSEGGEDSLENTVALCPNCHRKMHILGKKSDVEKLNARIAVG